MGPEPADLARSLVLVADDLEARGYPLVGVLRVAARELAVGPSRPAGDVCGCGAPIVQPATGRPRKYCTGCSPQKTPGKVHDAA